MDQSPHVILKISSRGKLETRLYLLGIQRLVSTHSNYPEVGGGGILDYSKLKVPTSGNFSVAGGILSGFIPELSKSSMKSSDPGEGAAWGGGILGQPGIGIIGKINKKFWKPNSESLTCSCIADSLSHVETNEEFVSVFLACVCVLSPVSVSCVLCLLTVS